MKGMLLYGPPGTGKTLMARQIGKMLNGKDPKVCKWIHHFFSLDLLIVLNLSMSGYFLKCNLALYCIVITWIVV